jgi:hypothetical protein
MPLARDEANPESRRSLSGRHKPDLALVTLFGNEKDMAWEASTGVRVLFFSPG